MLMRSSKRIRSLITMALVTMMIASGLISSGAVAAQNQSVQSQLTGVTISYGPSYVLQPDIGYADDVIEMIAFLGPADILSVGFMSPLIDLNGARDIMLEGLFGDDVTSAGIDRGNYTGVSYSLDMMNLDGSEMGVFSLFMNNRSHGFAEFYIFIAPPSLFGATMQTAQNSFTIDGNPLMDGVDSTVMGNMVVANVGITGGTAVTDVTEVTSQTNTTETTQTTQNTQVDANARTTYLAAVQAEFLAGDKALVDFLTAFDAFSKNTISAEEAGAVIRDTMASLAGTYDRALAIVAPAGMETFHQEFLAWAQSMSDVSSAWDAYTNGTATAEDHRVALVTAIENHESFAASFDREMNASTTGSTDQPANTTVAAPPDTNARATYLQAVQSEYDTVNTALTTILLSLDGLSNQTMTAAEVRPIMDASNLVLAGTNGRLAAIQPPAGMESFHGEFLNWAQAITQTGIAWPAAMQSGDTATFVSLLSAALDANSLFGETLDAELSSSPPATTGQTTTGNTSSTTATTRTTRTTRTTTDVTPEATEAAGTTRTTRTTRTTTDVTPDPTEAAATTRTTRTTRTTNPNAGTTQGNSSETGGNTAGTAASAGENWLMPQAGVTITWDDPFALWVGDAPAQKSDETTGSDTIYLQWEAGTGNPNRASISVSPSESGEASSIVTAMSSDNAVATEFFGVNTEVFDTEIGANASAVLMRVELGSGYAWAYVQFTCMSASCDQQSMLIVIANAEVLPVLLADMEQSVAIDGVSISNAIPASNVQDVIDTNAN